MVRYITLVNKTKHLIQLELTGIRKPHVHKLMVGSEREADDDEETAGRVKKMVGARRCAGVLSEADSMSM